MNLFHQKRISELIILFFTSNQIQWLNVYRSVGVFPFNNVKIELLPWKCTGASTILEKPSDSRLLLRQALQVDLQNVAPIKICALILPYIKKNQVCKHD